MLAVAYPASDHVRLLGMSTDDDEAIWRYAREQGFVIVSKDVDFFHRSMRYGPPPKVIWIRAGNCTTDTIARLLHENLGVTRAFVADPDAAFLPLE
jgi:predicted nuclease of predicted toxin-antitoxin system